MAPKRTAPTEIPLASSSNEEFSSSEKEDDEAVVESQKPSSTPSSDSEDATDSDDPDSKTETATNNSLPQMTDKTIGTKKPASLPQTKSKSIVESDSEEDATDSDDSASESERETEIKNNSKMESISKMTVETTGTKKPQSKAAAATQTATKSKRDSEKEPEPRFKRSRTEKVTSNGTTNQSKRLWSEEDELSLLTGMIDFTSKEKKSPISDVESFIKFIKNSLQIEVTRAQLTDKMRRMKKKYENNTIKEDNGIVYSSKGHDYKIHDLSKKIWGAQKTNGVGAAKVSGDLNTGSKKMAPGRKLTMEIENDTSLDLMHTDSMKNYNRIGDTDLEKYVLNEGFSLLEESKRTYLENKWKSLRNLELELFVKRMELITEQSKNVLEAHKAAYN